MKKILIVDDHLLIRIGVKNILDKILKNYEYFEAVNKSEALDFFRRNINFDLVILDINIPNYSCDQVIEICRMKCPSAKILILSMHSEKLMARRYYKLGIDAYVVKSADGKHLELAISDVLKNKKYFSEELLQQLASDLFCENKVNESPFEILTTREFEVMNLLFQGKSVQEISQILSIHQSSVSTYKARIYEKLMVGNIIELYSLFRVYNP